MIYDSRTKLRFIEETFLNYLSQKYKTQVFSFSFSYIQSSGWLARIVAENLEIEIIRVINICL